MNDMRDIERMTLYEYEIRAKAYKRMRLEEERALHLQAYLTARAKAMKPSGKKKMKAAYPTFKSFFDYEKALKNLYKDEQPALTSLQKFLHGRGSR